MIDYRQRVIEVAEDLVTTGFDASHGPFLEAYDRKLKKDRQMQLFNSSLFTVEYCMRMAGVPTKIFPLIKNCEFLPNTVVSDIVQPSDNIIPGDVIIKRSAVDDSISAGIIIKTNEHKLTMVSATDTSIASNPCEKVLVIEMNIIKNSGLILCAIRPKYETIADSYKYTYKLERALKMVYFSKFAKWSASLGIDWNDIIFNEQVDLDRMNSNRLREKVILTWSKLMGMYRKAPSTFCKTEWDDACREIASKCELKMRSSGRIFLFAEFLLYMHAYDPKGFVTFGDLSTLHDRDRQLGRFSTEMQQAVIAFQNARSLDETGTVTPETWESLMTRWYI